MKNQVVCLYEESGLSARDWALNGYEVFCYDQENDNRIERCGKGSIHYRFWEASDKDAKEQIIREHVGKTRLLLAFPPCTDLALSGARHFQKKRDKDPLFQERAMELVYIARDVGEALGCPWVIENPVGAISKLWRKPDFIFHPWQYGGYLPIGDVHPLYPKYILPRDAYPKKTCYWTGGGFTMPPQKPVIFPKGTSKQNNLLGGKSKLRSKVRSVSPRGIAKAIYLHLTKTIDDSNKILYVPQQLVMEKP